MPEALDVHPCEVEYWVLVDLIQYIPDRITTIGTSIARFLHESLLEQWVKRGVAQGRARDERPAHRSAEEDESNDGGGSEGIARLASVYRRSESRTKMLVQDKGSDVVF
jgi:hypothetical protein